jgi:Fe-Mn family superoxide dismutase
MPQEKNLKESFVASPKQYSLSTELLSAQQKTVMLQCYEAQIDMFNTTSAKLDVADRMNATPLGGEYRDLSLDFINNMNGIYLSQLYFSNIADPNSQLSMDSLSYLRLTRDFGTFDDWQKDFIAACMASRAGWGATIFSSFLQRYINVTLDGDSEGVPVGCHPIIVINVSPRVYGKDYLNNRKAYITNMMRELNWRIIEKRFVKTENMVKALK